MPRVRFTEERETLLGTLYARALDARSADPILGDEMAVRTVDQIDYDFSRLKVSEGTGATVAARAKYLDGWARTFLTTHPAATVVHLGCGLDTRVYRVDPGPDVRWYDVDYPEVVELRQQLYPARDGYHMLGSSVTEPGWLTDIPADQPTLVLAEGLTMYLRPDAGRTLLQRLTDRFPSGEIGFDAFNRVGIWSQKLNPVVRRSGSTLYWAIGDPERLTRWNPSLRLLESVSAFDPEPARDLPESLQPVVALFRAIGPLRRMSMYYRYGF